MKMIRNLRNYLVNKPAFFLSDNNYLRYLTFVGKAFNKFKFSIKQIKNDDFDFPLYLVRVRNQEILTTAAYRCSRYLKGFNHAAQRIWLRYRTPELLKQHKINTVLDIGANIGEYSKYVFDSITDNVHAFEPEPNTFKCLKNNLKSSNIKLYNFALSDKTGVFPFYSIPKSADSSLIGTHDSSQIIQISTFRLDDISKDLDMKGVVLLKMDAEGAEPEVLLGGLETLKKIHFVVIDAGAERFNEKTDIQVKEILVNSGFEVKIFPDGIVHAWRPGFETIDESPVLGNL